ncbi:hypothetical protein BGZ83_003196 [Gryganskiella cystojenkinii]|nr:hypothetical protein BGZ83_003196 [Gryganskiella cystojenkinii]
MDVVRITQALRQQNPGRLANNNSTRSTGGGGGGSFAHNSPSVAESNSSMRRDTWDGTSLSVNTSVASASSVPSTSGSSHNSNVSPSSASPSSTFSLASYLPAALAEASSGFFGHQANGGGASPSRMSLASVAGSTNLAEMEVQSLLLRSMPMFGNLISKE